MFRHRRDNDRGAQLFIEKYISTYRNTSGMIKTFLKDCLFI